MTIVWLGVNNINNELVKVLDLWNVVLIPANSCANRNAFVPHIITVANFTWEWKNSAIFFPQLEQDSTSGFPDAFSADASFCVSQLLLFLHLLFFLLLLLLLKLVRARHFFQSSDKNGTENASRKKRGIFANFRPFQKGNKTILLCEEKYWWKN